MTGTFPLIKRKLRSPVVPESFVRREGLLTRLRSGLDPTIKLTCVCAGPGYGKSTSVADYVRSVGVRHCWVNLEPFDADLTSFLHYVIGGVAAAWPEAPSPALELLSVASKPEAILPNLMGLFAEELGDKGDEPFILVLDDFHAVQEAEAIVRALEAFVAYVPDNVQLIVISRNQVPLRLPQLKVRQQLVEVGIPELRFNPPEVAELVRSLSGRELGPNEEQALLDSTEGWAASLVLAAQQAGGLPKAGEGDRLLFDYLAQEIYADLPPDRQAFLLRTSLLPAIEPEICQSVLELGPCDETILALRRSNLLLSRGESTDYYHPIFQAFLQAKLDETWPPEDVRELRQRIGEHLRPQQPEHALEVYLDGKLYAEAEAVVRDMALAYLAQFRLEGLDRLLRRFPLEVTEQSPWLLLFGGELLRLWGQPDSALARFERAERLAEAVGDRLVQGRSLAYQAALWGGRGDARLKDLAEKALEILPVDDGVGRSFAWNALGLFHQTATDHQQAQYAFEQALAFYRSTEDLIGQSKVLHNLGLTFTRMGDFARAAATYQESIRQAQQGGRKAFPATFNNLAAIHHLLGEFDQAWSVAEQGLSLAQQLGFRREELWTILTLAMIATSLGQHAKATDFFQQAREGGVAMGDKPLEAQALSGLADLSRLQGQFDRARELLNQAGVLRGLPIDSPELIDLQIPLGQLLLERGEPEQALDILRVARETVAAQGLRYRLALILLLESRSLFALGKPEAETRWEDARAICAANGYDFLLSQHPREVTTAIARVGTPVEALVSMAGPQLEIRCFGTFEAATEAGAIATKQWQGTKTKLVLAYLLHHRQGVTREQLAQLLYADEDVSRSAILMIISRMRQALEPDLAKNAPSRYVQWRDGRYFFNFGAPYELDVQEFEFHLDQAKDPGLSAPQQMEAYGKALTLYRGRYLKDLDESLWVQSVQEHFHQRAMAAFQRVLAYYEGQGDFEQLLVWADRAIEADNCAEFAHRAKMSALLRLGNRQAALRHYQQLEDVLSHELGVKPAAESRQLYDRIVAGKN